MRINDSTFLTWDKGAEVKAGYEFRCNGRGNSDRQR